jgi:hypothetical protein
MCDARAASRPAVLTKLPTSPSGGDLLAALYVNVEAGFTRAEVRGGHAAIRARAGGAMAVRAIVGRLFGLVAVGRG